ncbi:MAG TPA: molybdopterin molybdotransferase MoeA, partial [Candidatus Angelobacter sp.]|nr:molybdopterin molybdotransferase MoeA [Candidatus Angelobacter sp.]
MNTATQTAGVLSFEEAYEVVRTFGRRILQKQERPAEEVPLVQALGRSLAEPVVADRDFPPFPRSTRDGYAMRATDLNQNGSALLRVVGQVKAGDSYDLPIGPGEAVEIMTGAAVPQGADAVVMVEYTTRKSPSEAGVGGCDGAQQQETPQKASSDGDDDVLEALHDPLRDSKSSKESPGGTIAEDFVEIRRATATGENIVPAGAEAKAGQELLPKGTRLRPAQIALAAAAGKARVKVFAKPRVAILSTGDELVDVAEKPGPSQIRNSNSYSLAALVAAHG